LIFELKAPKKGAFGIIIEFGRHLAGESYKTPVKKGLNATDCPPQSKALVVS
jgi:hypothetical protein